MNNQRLKSKPTKELIKQEDPTKNLGSRPKQKGLKERFREKRIGMGQKILAEDQAVANRTRAALKRLPIPESWQAPMIKLSEAVEGFNPLGHALAGTQGKSISDVWTGMDIDSKTLLEGIKNAEAYIRDSNEGSFAVAGQGKRRKVSGPSSTEIQRANDPMYTPLPRDSADEWRRFVEFAQAGDEID